MEHKAINKQEIPLKITTGTSFFYKKVYSTCISEIMQNIEKDIHYSVVNTMISNDNLVQNIEKDIHYSVVDAMISNDNLVDITYSQILNKVNIFFNSKMKEEYFDITRSLFNY